MNTNIPTVGSTVRVTTRHKNIYYLTADKEPHVFNTYEGTVIPNNKWDEPYTFTMTGTKNFPTRNIHMDCVTHMKILKGSSKAMDKSIRAFRISSKSSGKVYVVVKNGTKYTCDCMGFQYRKHCKHIDGVHRKVG